MISYFISFNDNNAAANKMTTDIVWENHSRKNTATANKILLTTIATQQPQKKTETHKRKKSNSFLHCSIEVNKTKKTCILITVLNI